MTHAFVLAVLAALPAPSSPSAHEDAIVASSVRTAHECPEGPGRSVIQGGSGTVIKRTRKELWVLTCAHVVEHRGAYGKGRLTVTAAGGEVLPAVLAYHCPLRDLSLLRVPLPGGKTLPKVKAARLAKREDYRPGKRVVKCGYPGAGPRVILPGKCLPDVSMNARDNSITSLVATAPSRSGDSGGGVFRASDGKLVGVIWGGKDGKLWATKLAEIRWLLGRAGLEPGVE